MKLRPLMAALALAVASLSLTGCPVFLVHRDDGGHHHRRHHDGHGHGHGGHGHRHHG